MNTLITMPSVNQFTAYGVGNFPTSMQKIVIDSGITSIAEHFDSPQSYKQTLQFALEQLPPTNRKQVLFLILGGKQ